MTKWVIFGEFDVSDDGDGYWLFWNNENGWGDFKSATVFTDAERDKFLRMNRMPQGAWGWGRHSWVEEVTT